MCSAVQAEYETPPQLTAALRSFGEGEQGFVFDALVVYSGCSAAEQLCWS